MNHRLDRDPDQSGGWRREGEVDPHHADDPAADDPAAATAGEQDHTDPWTYAGPVADPPRNP